MLNEEKFLTIYEDFKGSGLTVREYCSNLGMCQAKFYYWKKKLKEKHHENKAFVPLVFEQERNRQLPAKAIIPDQSSQVYEICYSNGTRIKLGGQTNMEVLRELLQLTIAADV